MAGNTVRKDCGEKGKLNKEDWGDITVWYVFYYMYQALRLIPEHQPAFVMHNAYSFYMFSSSALTLYSLLFFTFLHSFVLQV